MVVGWRACVVVESEMGIGRASLREVHFSLHLSNDSSTRAEPTQGSVLIMKLVSRRVRIFP
jgi:hypothetical protein